MPNTQSAKKALRQNETRRLRNLKFKELYKKAVKETRKAVSAKDQVKAGEFLSSAFRALDKAAKNKVIEKNKASRLKSRLAVQLDKVFGSRRRS